MKPRPSAPTLRLRLKLRGAVQGVGFRPFVYRLAGELRLAGWVSNSPQGVLIEAEGERAALETFLIRLEKEKPPHSAISGMETEWLAAAGDTAFEIRASEPAGDKTTLVLPDLATCPDCLREIFDPSNRRFRYPFTNCTHCGPRFSIIEALPYDRANTSMKSFTMCPACQAEYDDPRDRRFHAQPNACPVCGPRLEGWDAAGQTLATGDAALLAAAEMIRQGKIVAVKGLGGFHLMADARHAAAVQLLRVRKQREEKPFALMFPSLDAIRQACHVTPLEENLLNSPAAPIVLLKKIANRKSPIVNSVAPGHPNLGVMLPSNPLYHLLLRELNFPIVATSGNLSDEPICTDEHEALSRLRGLADFFLVHNRPIVRHVDDSIVRELLGGETILRRARGYAPLPVHLKLKTKNSKLILAVGAHLKNAVALAVDENVFLSQHLGDLETEQAHTAFRRACEDLPRLYGVESRAGVPPARAERSDAHPMLALPRSPGQAGRLPYFENTLPEIVAADLHPDYLSTQFALKSGRTVVPVQHHVAHVLSCIAENAVDLPALGVAWDGTGYGTDGTIWGGEFFRVSAGKVERVACLRPFRLPGGEAAVKEPRRAALGLLYELLGEAVFERADLLERFSFSRAEIGQLGTLLRRGLNSPWTSSVGRLFDAVASLAGVRQVLRYEGQAAMELEFACAAEAVVGQASRLSSAQCAAGILPADQTYPELRLIQPSKQNWTGETPVPLPLLQLDWSPLIQSVLADVQHGISAGIISLKFHQALAEAVVAVAKRAGERRVALSGGCFQNRWLATRVVERLRAENFQPYWHRRVPANDGGIALGQIYAVRNQMILT